MYNKSTCYVDISWHYYMCLFLGCECYFVNKKTTATEMRKTAVDIKWGHVKSSRFGESEVESVSESTLKPKSVHVLHPW